MIPRAVVAEALGLPDDTDDLPPGDLPLDRFAARFVGYLSVPEAGAETPDAWTGAVFDRLVEEDAALALQTLIVGAGVDAEGVLVDPLQELAGQPGMPEAIASAAESDPAFAALMVRAAEAEASVG